MEDEAHQKKILASLTYHWSEADGAVIQIPDPRRLERSRGFMNRGGTVSMGHLALLPREILDAVLSELDFRSLGAMRSLNTRSRDVVGTLPAYGDLATFAHDALRALSATGLLTRYSAKHLYSAFCQDRCFGCNGFGSFLFLPTASRCCFTCIETKPEMNLIFASTAAKNFELTDQAMRQIAILTTVPGVYGIPPYPYHGRFQLVCRDEARKVGIELHGSEAEMERAAALVICGGDILLANERLQQAANRPSIPQASSSKSTFRYMGCAPFPYLDLHRGRIDEGVCCRGCEYDWCRRKEDFPSRHENSQNLLRLQHKIFAADEFLVHFEQCYHAGMLWREYILEDRGLSKSAWGSIFRK